MERIPATQWIREDRGHVQDLEEVLEVLHDVHKINSYSLRKEDKLMCDILEKDMENIRKKIEFIKESLKSYE